MNLIKKIIPTDEREFEERFERIRHDTIRKVDKDISGVAKEVTSEVAPTDFIAAMYAPTAKKPEVGSGETASFGQQITPKPNELLSDVGGSPIEPGQKPPEESAIGQVRIPIMETVGAAIGSPVESSENTSTESGTEQLLPTAGQVIGHATGSIQTERVTPHMETTGQQIVPHLDEAAGLLGFTSSESGHGSALSGTEQGSKRSGAENNPGQQGSAEMQQMAAQQQQKGQAAELNRAAIDPSMQMGTEERAKYTQEQKEKREHMMLHDTEYRKFGTPLDDIGSLEQQVSKVRQQKEQEEKQKLEEEEEEKKKKEEEEKKKQEELPEPSTKAKPGDPNISIGQSQKKTEVHRGSSG